MSQQATAVPSPVPAVAADRRRRPAKLRRAGPRDAGASRFRSARAIVEFGPGTGAFTREIAARLAPGCRYLGIELNPTFVRDLAGKFPRLTFVHGSVADLTRVLVTHGIAAIDAIVCGLAVGVTADLAPGIGVRRDRSSTGAGRRFRDVRLSAEPGAAGRLGVAPPTASRLRRGRHSPWSGGTSRLPSRISAENGNEPARCRARWASARYRVTSR